MSAPFRKANGPIILKVSATGRGFFIFCDSLGEFFVIFVDCKGRYSAIFKGASFKEAEAFILGFQANGTGVFEILEMPGELKALRKNTSEDTEAA